MALLKSGGQDGTWKPPVLTPAASRSPSLSLSLCLPISVSLSPSPGLSRLPFLPPCLSANVLPHPRPAHSCPPPPQLRPPADRTPRAGGHFMVTVSRAASSPKETLTSALSLPHSLGDPQLTSCRRDPAPQTQPLGPTLSSGVGCNQAGPSVPAGFQVSGVWLWADPEGWAAASTARDGPKPRHGAAGHSHARSPCSLGPRTLTNPPPGASGTPQPAHLSPPSPGESPSPAGFLTPARPSGLPWPSPFHPTSRNGESCNRCTDTVPSSRGRLTDRHTASAH